MNCLTEALGLALPGNGSIARHPHRAQGALRGRRPHRRRDRARATTSDDDESVLPRAIATARGVRERDDARHRDGRLDQHRAAPARRRAGGRARLHDARHRRRSRAACPCLCKVAPNGTYLMEDVHRAGGIPAILGELRRGGLLHEDVDDRALAHRWTSGSAHWDIRGGERRRTRRSSSSTPRRAACARRPRSRSPSAGSRSTPTPPRAASATSRTPTPPTAAWRSSTATSRVRGCVVKTAGVDESILHLHRPGASSSSPRTRRSS